MKGNFELSMYLKISGKQAAQKRETALQEGILVPSLLQAEISARCNLPGTAYHKGCDYKERLLNISEWDSLFREADQLGIRFVFLSGGEPLMEREILERAARYQDMWFLVFTNGTLLDEKYYRFFSDHRNLIPILSMEIGSDINLDKMGKSSYLYESQMYSMDALSRRDIMYGVCVTLTRENERRVVTRGFLSGLERRKCNGVVYLEYKGDERLSLDEEECRMVERELEEIQKEYADMLFCMFPKGAKLYTDPFDGERGVLRVEADGAVYPVMSNEGRVGDLKECRLRDILKRDLLSGCPQLV